MTNTQCKFTATLTTAIAIAILNAPAAFGSVVDFDSFTSGQSVNGQGQWTVEDSFGNAHAPAFDEEVVDLGGGNNVWRISNGVTSSSYSDQPFSNRPAQVAGETNAGLYNDFGPDHTMPYSPPHSSATAMSPYFHAAWDFKSATGAAQPGMVTAISASASQSTLRETYISISDNGSTGLDLDFYDTTGNAAFNLTNLASDLSYADWHTVDMYIQFVDGIGPGAAGSEAGNDIVTLLVDGSPVFTGTTWESYFYNTADGGPAGTRAVNSLMFRESGTAVPANMGGGLYFDNVTVDNAVIPEPSTFVLAVAGAFGLFAVYRRRRRAA